MWRRRVATLDPKSMVCSAHGSPWTDAGCGSRRARLEPRDHVRPTLPGLRSEVEPSSRTSRPTMRPTRPGS